MSSAAATTAATTTAAIAIATIVATVNATISMTDTAIDLFVAGSPLALLFFRRRWLRRLAATCPIIELGVQSGTGCDVKTNK
jgi:hypothetical protein